MKKYLRFGAMIVVSTVAMFFLMYMMTYSLGHATFSESRTYMALVMGATMGVIMLGFMLNMYTVTKVNAGILLLCAVVFALTLYLARSQQTIGDVAYMKAMIPHHSMAILTSERAHITDPRVRQVAEEIIESQRREISEMKFLIEELEGEEGR